MVVCYGFTVHVCSALDTRTTPPNLIENCHHETPVCIVTVCHVTNIRHHRCGEPDYSDIPEVDAAETEKKEAEIAKGIEEEMAKQMGGGKAK